MFIFNSDFLTSSFFFYTGRWLFIHLQILKIPSCSKMMSIHTAKEKLAQTVSKCSVCLNLFFDISSCVYCHVIEIFDWNVISFSQFELGYES